MFACTASAGEAQGDAQDEMRPAEDCRERAVTPGVLDVDGAMVADDTCHVANDCGCLDWRIAAWDGVSACNEAVGEFADDAVRYEAAAGAVEDDLAGLQVCELTAPHGNFVSGPHGGQHAGSCESEAYLACVASDLGHQFAACGATLGLGQHVWLS
jgi:hypothetical protein